MEMTINGGNRRYLSEIPELRHGLPHGVVNKVIPDVGGTYLAANCDSDYIIVCPFIDLVESIGCDSNNKYDILKVYGDITGEEILEYCDNHETHKIAVTYNSFKKLTDTLYGKYMLEDYKILIDEYHTILEDMNYRESEITDLMNEVKRYRHYTFLSATPIDEDYEIGLIKGLPHYRVIWDRITKVKPTEIRVSHLLKGVSNLIRTFMDEGIRLPDINGDIKEVEELYIFMNSVNMITDLIDFLGLKKEETKICCANTNRNRWRLKKHNHKISFASDPSKKINFFTKKCFQGCNMFTNNGLVIVVSDARKWYTMVDISCAMEQIAGRLRFNKSYQNIFRNTLIHIYSNAKFELSEEEFLKETREKERDALELMNIIKRLNGRTKRVFVERISSSLSKDFVSVYNKDLIYNEMKVKSYIYQHRLRKMYSEEISIVGGCDNLNEDKIIDVLTPILRRDVTRWGHIGITANIYRLRYKAWLDGDDKLIDSNPEFRDYKKYLKETEMNSLRWKKEKMIGLVNDRRRMDELYDYVCDYYYRSDGVFVSNKELKAVIAEGIKKLGMGIAAKASLIDGCKWATKKKMNKDGKRLVGYLITKDNETGSKKKSKEG